MAEEARYLYAVARTEAQEPLGDIGIEDKAVYTIPYRDIAAVVHCCQPKPYETKDKTLAEEWVLEHSYVIDQATKQFGTVLPFSFDVIIRGDDSVVREWLSRNYDSLFRDLGRVEDKAEYSVQIYYDYDDFAAGILSRNEELDDLRRRIEREPKGKAYLLRRSMESKLKETASKEAIRLSDQFCSRIRPLVEELKLEDKRSRKPDKYKDREHLASYTCLVRDEKVEMLGEVLDEIQKMEGFAVRFTGPWAPFSFVSLMEARRADET
jgi:hypothetical protein